ncbi:unnamed protein product, partial [Owenia fusiformis]
SKFKMASKGQQVDITTLPVPQLNQLNQQLEQEVEFFQNSLSQLKMAQAKFIDSQECLDTVKPENEGKDILVPLTSSMYVTGQLRDTSSVMIDVGTGYYVEKDVAKAKLYFKKKIEYLTKQMEKIQPALQDKYRTKQAVMEVLQMRVQAQIAAQQQAGGVKS